MTRRRAALAVLAGAAGGVLALVPVASGGSTAPVAKRTVQVADDYFLPARLTVRPRTRIVWRWLPENEATHDVKLRRAPTGVRRFQSDPATADFTFRRTLYKRGTYSIICTYHRAVMRRTIVVK